MRILADVFDLGSIIIFECEGLIEVENVMISYLVRIGYFLKANRFLLKPVFILLIGFFRTLVCLVRALGYNLRH